MESNNLNLQFVKINSLFVNLKIDAEIMIANAGICNEIMRLIEEKLLNCKGYLLEVEIRVSLINRKNQLYKLKIFLEKYVRLKTRFSLTTSQ